MIFSDLPLICFSSQYLLLIADIRNCPRYFTSGHTGANFRENVITLLLLRISVSALPQTAFACIHLPARSSLGLVFTAGEAVVPLLHLYVQAWWMGTGSAQIKPWELWFSWPCTSSDLLLLRNRPPSQFSVPKCLLLLVTIYISFACANSPSNLTAPHERSVLIFLNLLPGHLSLSSEQPRADLRQTTLKSRKSWTQCPELQFATLAAPSWSHL